MKTQASLTYERRIPANPAAVWSVIADPRMQERLEPRCRLESMSGDGGRPGSEFILAVGKVRMRYFVVAADPEVRWVAEISRGRKEVAVQAGDNTDEGTHTLLRWTVTVSGGPLTRRLWAWSCKRELPQWLAAVEREVLANRP